MVRSIAEIEVEEKALAEEKKAALKAHKRMLLLKSKAHCRL